MYYDDLKTGNYGRETVKKYLESLEDTSYVKDVSDDENLNNYGIDLIWIRTDKKTAETVMVRTDRKADNTKNFVYEDVENKKKKTPGKFKRMKASMILYFCSGNRALYAINPVKLDKYVHAEDSTCELKNMGDHGQGYVLQIDDLVTEKVAKIFGYVGMI